MKDVEVMGALRRQDAQRKYQGAVLMGAHTGRKSVGDPGIGDQGAGMGGRCVREGIWSPL